MRKGYRFVRAVVKHWGTLMTGGAVWALLLVYERYWVMNATGLRTRLETRPPNTSGIRAASMVDGRSYDFSQRL